jgi:hypothetical protein
MPISVKMFKRRQQGPVQQASVFDTLKTGMQQGKQPAALVSSLIADPGKPVADVTIMINVWKRTHIEEQLFHLLSQSVYPKEIWVLYYEQHVNVEDTIRLYQKQFPFITIIRSDKNLRYFGRFSIAVNVTTKYTWIIDDDVIPGEQWLANCVEKCEALNSIISCTGRIIPRNNFRPERWRWGNSYKHFIGDEKNGGQMNYCEGDTKVDYACNSYFIKSAWMQAFWSIWPVTFSSGEDIHLSAACSSRLGVGTFVLAQSSIRDSGNIKRPYGWDVNASWKKKDFINIREEVLRYHIEKNNWTPLLWK